MSDASKTITGYMSAFWKGVIGDGVNQGNTALIVDKLSWLSTQVESTEAKIKNDYTEPIFAKFTIDAAKLKEAVAQNGFYQLIKDSTLDIPALRRSFEAMDINEASSVNAFIAEVNKTLDEILKNSTDTYLQAVKNSTKSTIQAIADFILYLNQDNPTEIQTHVDTLIQAIADWFGVVASLDEPQKGYVLSMLQRSELVVSLLSHYRDPVQEPPLPEPSRYERIQQFREDLPKAETEMRKGKLPKQQEVKELHLAEIFDVGMGFADIQSYESVQVMAKKIQGIIHNFFVILNEMYAENPTFSPPNRGGVGVTPYLAFAEAHIIHWLELPEDFRPENWVEVIHYIVQNIQYSFESISDPSFAPVNARVLPILRKLNDIFSKVNNDDFKLLITPKESLGIYNIDLPDLLDDDEEEEEEETPLALPVAKHQEPVKLQERGSHEAGALHDGADEPYEKHLTYSSVIEFLCFDDTFGAMAKLDKEKGYANVIRSLYYNNWIGSRMYVVEMDMYDFVEKNSLSTHWENIKAHLLDEKGLNIGDFVQFLIDKMVSVVNDFIDFVKKTIQYIIDEIFKLTKAIIEFFQKVDLPLNARELLKKIPLFEAMPDGVTLLHIIAAIPYTLYTEFMNFEPQMQAA